MSGIIGVGRLGSGVINRLNAPSGTKMVFNQTTSPTGWTKVTSANDVALRLVSGTVSTGGTVAFETALTSHTPTISMSNAAVTLSTSQIPAHSHVHNFIQWGNNATQGYPTYKAPYDNGGVRYHSTENTGGGGAHTHGNSASSSAVNLDVSYVDVIIATKD